MRYVALLALLACDGGGGATTDAGSGDGTSADAPDHTGEYDVNDGSRLKVVWFQGEDGTRHPSATSFWDSTHQELCSPEKWADGVIRCTPEGQPVVYADSACTQPLGQVTHPGTDPMLAPHFVARQWIDGEVRVAAVYPGGSGSGQQLAAAYDRGADGACEELGYGTNYYYYSHYALATPLDDFAVLHLDEPAATQRLVPTLWTSDDGFRIRVGLRDRQLATPCQLQPSAEAGIADCVPPIVAGSSYADASCSRPIAQAFAPTPIASPVFGTAVANADDWDRDCTIYWATIYTGVSSPNGYVHNLLGVCQAETFHHRQFSFAGTEPLVLAQATRAIENAAGRRYQRIHVGNGVDIAFSDTLFDSQLGYECRFDPRSATCKRVVHFVGLCR